LEVGDTYKRIFLSYNEYAEGEMSGPERQIRKKGEGKKNPLARGKKQAVKKW
jgi:hypothetical protein